LGKAYTYLSMPKCKKCNYTVAEDKQADGASFVGPCKDGHDFSELSAGQGAVPLDSLKRLFKPVLREVGRQQIKRRGCWTPSNASLKRGRSREENQAWKDGLIAFYQDDFRKANNSMCMVLSASKTRAHVRASHIWKYATGGRGLGEFGLAATEVTSMRNGLLLTTGIEMAFDSLQLTFVYNPFLKKFFVYLLDVGLAREKIMLKEDQQDGKHEYSEITFGELHLTESLYLPTTGNMPYRRLLYYHAKCAFENARLMGWHYSKQDWKSYRDLSDGISDDDVDDDAEDEAVC